MGLLCPMILSQPKENIPTSTKSVASFLHLTSGDPRHLLCYSHTYNTCGLLRSYMSHKVTSLQSHKTEGMDWWCGS